MGVDGRDPAGMDATLGEGTASVYEVEGSSSAARATSREGGAADGAGVREEGASPLSLAGREKKEKRGKGEHKEKKEKKDKKERKDKKDRKEKKGSTYGGGGGFAGTDSAGPVEGEAEEWDRSGTPAIAPGSSSASVRTPVSTSRGRRPAGFEVELVTPMSRSDRDRALAKAREADLIYSQSMLDAKVEEAVAKAVREAQVGHRIQEVVGMVMNAAPVGPPKIGGVDRLGFLDQIEAAMQGFMNGEPDNVMAVSGGTLHRRDSLRQLMNLCVGRGYLDQEELARDPPTCLVLCEAVVEFRIVDALVEVIHEFDAEVHNAAILCLAAVASLVTCLPPNEGKPYESMLKRKITSDYVLDAVVLASAYPSISDAEGQATLMHLLLALDATERLPTKVWEMVLAHALSKHCPDSPEVAWLADAVMLNVCVKRAKVKGRNKSIGLSVRYSSMIGTVPFFTFVKANLSMHGCLELMTLGEGGRRTVAIIFCSQTGIDDLAQHNNDETRQVSTLLQALERVDKEVLGWQRFLLNSLKENDVAKADQDLAEASCADILTASMKKAMEDVQMGGSSDAENVSAVKTVPNAPKALDNSTASTPLTTSDPKRNWNLMRQATRLALGRESRVDLIETIESLKTENAALAHELMLMRRNLRISENRRFASPETPQTPGTGAPYLSPPPLVT